DEIPASGFSTITSSNVTANGNLLAYAVTINGVAGTISYTSGSLRFTRAEAGTAVPVAPDTAAIPTLGPLFRDCVLYLNIGKNDLTSGSGTEVPVIDRTHQAFAYATAFIKRVLVWGHF